MKFGGLFTVLLSQKAEGLFQQNGSEPVSIQLKWIAFGVILEIIWKFCLFYDVILVFNSLLVMRNSDGYLMLFKININCLLLLSTSLYKSAHQFMSEPK